GRLPGQRGRGHMAGAVTARFLRFPPPTACVNDSVQGPGLALADPLDDAGVIQSAVYLPPRLRPGTTEIIVKDGGFPILGEVGQIAGCVEFAWNGFAIENAAFARKPYFAACVRKCKIFQQAKFVDELHLVQQLEHNLARETSL